MTVQIENYKGWNISFNTDKETFYAESDEYDRAETKKSYATAKKFIDDFIKDNLEFKPFWIEVPPSSYDNRKQIKIIGIRKDKRFVFEDAYGTKQQLSEYSEKNYILVNPDNEEFYEKIADCNKRIKSITEERTQIEAKIIKVGLEEIKRKYSF